MGACTEQIFHQMMLFIRQERSAKASFNIEPVSPLCRGTAAPGIQAPASFRHPAICGGGSGHEKGVCAHQAGGQFFQKELVHFISHFPENGKAARSGGEAGVEETAEYLDGPVRNLLGCQGTVVLESQEKAALPGICKSHVLSQHEAAPGSLQSVDKAVLGHPLLPGACQLKGKEFFCVAAPQFRQYRTFCHLLFIGAVFQRHPQKTVQRLAETRAADAGKEIIHNVRVIPFMHISDDGIHVEIRLSILGKSRKGGSERVVAGGGPDNVQSPPFRAGQLLCFHDICILPSFYTVKMVSLSAFLEIREEMMSRTRDCS